MKFGKKWLWLLGIAVVAVALAIAFSNLSATTQPQGITPEALTGTASPASPASNPAPATSSPINQPDQTVTVPQPTGIVQSSGFDQEAGWVNYRLKVQKDASGNYYASNRYNWSFYQEIKLEPNKWYSLDARVRKGPSTTPARIRVQYYGADGALLPDRLDYYHTFQGKDWENIPTQKFCTPLNFAKANIFLLSGDAATHDFDDILITPATAPPAPVKTAPPAVKVQSYIVEPGDSLEGIASNYRVTVQQLIEANKLADPNNIYPGQELVIPAK